MAPADSFWGLAADHLKVDDVYNYSWTGNSVTSVCHVVISQQQFYDWERDYFIIGIPVLERLTMFDNFNQTKYTYSHFETAHWQEQQNILDCHAMLQNLSWQNIKDKELVVHENRSWTEAQALDQIFLLASWLDSVGARYLILNLSKPFSFTEWPTSNFSCTWARAHGKMILFDNTYSTVNENINKPVDYDQYGWHGHHGSAGNKRFFEKSVKPKLEELYC